MLFKSVKGAENEKELHGLFQGICHKLGANGLAYMPIVGAGTNPSILHYKNNDQPIKPGNFVLVDAGCEFSFYAADITRTFPSNGMFSKPQREIYNLVLEMQHEVIKAIKPGVKWEYMHLLAMNIATKGLLRLDILIGDEIGLMESNIVAAFFPHGLGHSIGLDVHDVGGYPNGVDRIDKPGLCYLRMRRELKEGMVVTVEPGVYFSDVILDTYQKDPQLSKLVNWAKVKEYSDIGGVRIEDSVVVTKDGYINLTLVPKSIEEIENLML